LKVPKDATISYKGVVIATTSGASNGEDPMDGAGLKH